MSARMDPPKVKDECLCKAARRNDVKTIRKLIAAKQIEPCVADLRENENKQKLCYQDYYPGNKDFEDRTNVNKLSCLNRALHYMCDDYNTTGDTEEVDVPARNDTPLLKAAGEKFMDIMKLLIGRGADVSDKGNKGILYEPVVRGYEDVVKFLLEQGVVPTAGYVDCAFKNKPIIRMLLMSNPDIITDWTGLFASMDQMVKLHMNEELAILLEHGVDPNMIHPDRPMRCLVHVAARYRNNVGMQMLLAAGAKIDLDDKAQLALQRDTEAAQSIKKQLDAFGILSENVVEWSSPLYIATKHYAGRKMLCRILEAGANVLAVTEKGRLPLHVASPDTRAVHLLASEPYNCPLDVKDLNGATPLMINVTKEEWEWYRPPLSDENPCIMLLQHGASYEYKAPDRSFLYHMARHQKLNPNICQVVIYSGNDLQVILRDIQEVQEMAEKQKDTSGYQWLVNFLTNPESLKMMSVRAIRSQLRKARLGRSIWGSIFRLPLPKPPIQLITLNHLQLDFGPWNLYGSVHPHVLEEFYRLHFKEFVWEEC